MAFRGERCHQRALAKVPLKVPRDWLNQTFCQRDAEKCEARMGERGFILFTYNYLVGGLGMS